MVNRKMKSAVRVDAFIDYEAKQTLADMAEEAGKGVSMSDLIRTAIDEFLNRTTAADIECKPPSKIQKAMDVLEYLLGSMKGHGHEFTSISIKASSVGVIIGETKFSECRRAVQVATEILHFKGIDCIFLDDVKERPRADGRVVVEKDGFVIEFHRQMTAKHIEIALKEAKSDFANFGRLVKKKILEEPDDDKNTTGNQTK